MVAEIGQAVRLLLGGHFRAAQHENVAVVRIVFGQTAVSRGIVVGDGDHVNASLQSERDDVLRCHVQITAGGKQGMCM